jgi:hypothetical protein
MELGLYTMAPEPISTAYLIETLTLVCVSNIARQRLSEKKLPLKRMHKQQYNCWTRRFLCGSCRVKKVGDLFPEFLICYLVYTSSLKTEDTYSSKLSDSLRDIRCYKNGFSTAISARTSNQIFLQDISSSQSLEIAVSWYLT